MNRSEFDRRFDAAFERASQLSAAVPEPDYRASWARMQTKLRSQRKSRRARTAMGRLAILAVAVLIGAFLLDSASTVRAIEPMYAKLVKSPSGMLSFFFGREEDRNPPGAKTAPPPDYAPSDTSDAGLSATRSVTTDMEGARATLAFPAPAFGYLPDDFTLQTVEVFYDQAQERANSVVYSYLNENNGYLVHLFFKKLQGTTGTSANPGGEGVLSEQIQLRDGLGILTTAADGSVQLESVTGDIQISFSGRAPADEFVRIYEEMRL